MQFPNVNRFVFATAAVLTLATASARADVVRLTGGRSMRVVAVSTKGADATLTLPSGGTVVMPAASIESIQPELIAADLCGASPFRCQDRAMLMGRRTQAATETPQPAHH